MAATLPHVWYCNFGNGSSTGYYAVSTWTANHAYSAGQIIRQNTTPTQLNERCFICIVAGTSSNPTEPTWTVTKGAKTTDNTVTWQECTGWPAVNGDSTNTPASSTERSQSISLGTIIKNNGADHYFICSTAGTCGAGEPTYNTTTGATTADNTVTWTCIGAVSSFNTAWQAPGCHIGGMTPNWVAAGDTIYVSASSAETLTSAASGVITTGSNTTVTSIICVSNTPSLPPVTGDITTGASITCSSSSFPSLTGAIYMVGVALTSNAASLNISLGTSYGHYVNCPFTLGGSSTQGLAIGGPRTKNILENCTVGFGGSNTAGISVSGRIIWKNTASAVSKTGTNWPSQLFGANLGTNGSGDMLIENVDLSSFAGTNFIGSNSTAGRVVFKDCKLPNITLGSGQVVYYGMAADFINCDTAGSIYNHSRWWAEGTQTTSTTAVRTGGASDGTTAYSWQIATSSLSQWIEPFESLPICIWNTIITPSSTTITIEAAYVGTSLPNTDDIWIDVNYYGTSSSTLGTCQTTTKSNVLASGTGWSSSTALWGGSAAARQNSHAYALGDMIGVSSASSIVRLFVCTTAGTSSGSLPGGYATAVDGSQITDGTAVMTAVERFQLTTTISSPKVQSAGFITVYVYCAKPSATFFLDPVITLS